MKNILRFLTLLILTSFIKTADAQVYTNLGDVRSTVWSRQAVQSCVVISGVWSPTGSFGVLA